MLNRFPPPFGLSAGATSVTGSGTVAFSNSNGISFGLNGSTVTASHNALTSQSNPAFSASGGSSTFQTLSFGNSNGFTFSNSNGSLVPVHDLQYTSNRVSAGLSNVGNTAGDTGVVTGRLVLAGGNNITLSGSTNGGSMTVSVVGGAGGGFSAGVSNVGNTAGATGVSGTRLVFVGSQNITLSQTTDANGATISFSGGAGAAGNTGFLSAGTQTASLGTVSFANSNGISFGLSNQTFTASHNGLTTARASNDAIGLNTAQTNVTWTVNSSGLSINASGYAGTATAVTGNVSATVNSGGVSLNAANLAGTGFATTTSNGSVIAATHNTTGLTLGVPAFLTTAMASNAATISNINVSAGTTSTNASAFTFANANGVSFGLGTGASVGSITASHNGLTSQSNQAFSAQGGSSAFQTLGFSNQNGVTFTNTNGSVGITHDLQFTSATSNITSNALHSSASRVFNAIAATNNTGGGTASLSSNVSFSNANGATFYTSAGNAIALSYTVPTVPAQFSGGVSGGNTSGDTGFVTGRLAIVGGNNVTVSGSTNGGSMTLTISGANAGGAQTGISGIVVSDTTYTSGTVSFSNANGISFGSSAGQAITASHNGLTTARASNDAVGLNTALTAGPLAWTVNSSGISLNAGSAAGTTSGFAGNLISGSMTHNTAGLNLSLNHPAWLTTAMASNAATISNVNVSAGTTSTNASAFTFANSNGVSFGLGTGASVGSITASHNGLTSQSNQNVTAANGGFAFQTLSFSNVNGISFGTSAGSAITASHNALTTARASTDGIGLNTAQTNVTWTVNSSGLSFNAAGYAGTGFTSTTTAGTAVVATNNTAGLSMAIPAFLTAAAGGGGAAISADANSQSTGTVNFANSNGISFGLSNNGTMTASYNSTQFAGQGTTFAGANISASMTLNSNGLNLSASVAAPGAAAEQNAINLLGANTAGNTTATGSTIGFSGINLTLSGTNVSQVVFSAPATSSLVGASGMSISSNGSTISLYPGALPVGVWGNYSDVEHLAAVVGQNTVWVQPMFVPDHIAFSELQFPINYSNATNSSNSCTISYQAGVYTQNGASLSLLDSASTTFATTNSGTAGAMSRWLGKKNLYIGWTQSLTPGQYWLAMRSQTTTGGGAGMTFSNFVASNMNTAYSGRLGVGSNASNLPMLGLGSYSVTSTGLPTAIGFTEMRGSAAAALRGVVYQFAGSHV